MRTVKRLVATLLEIATEAIFWGCLLGALIANGVDPAWYGVLGSILALPVVLFLHGYYVTRVLAGVVLRRGNRWLYPAIVSTLFAAHTYVVFVRLKPDMSALGNAVGPPFIAGGVCVVFACAVVGDWLLRKWIQSASPTRSV
jgi:hypothetical protein